MYVNPLIILKLRSEGCFRHLSAKLHSAGLRMKNHSAEIGKSFGAERLTALSHERELKYEHFIFQSVICYIIDIYHTS